MLSFRLGSSRQRKIWLSVGATLLGTMAVTQLGLWVQAARNTDLKDPTAGITASDLEHRVQAPPIRFRDVAAQMGVTMRHGPGPRHRKLPEDTGSGLAWGDFDGDGDFDLYVVSSPNKLYRNMLAGPGDSFYSKLFHVQTSEVSKTSEVFQTHSKDKQGKPLAFADVSALTGAADFRGSMGLSVAETGALNDNLDGLPDLFLTHWVAQENVLYQSARLAEGFLEYRDKTRQFRLGEISLSTVGWGCGFCDLDLDGRPDLAVANGSTLEPKEDVGRLIAEPIFLFWNDGKQFQDVAPRAGETVAAHHCARGLAIADFDNDGLPDIAISINRGQPLLLRNETRTANRALKVRLKGPSAACFGAKVEVFVGGDRQVQWWGADVSFLSQHAPELIFGLAEHQTADRVHVFWADGKETRLSTIRAGGVQIAHPE